MQIVIDIPEEEYIRICDEPCTELGLAVRNGTSLPEHHGRLIDADALIYSLSSSDRDIYCKDVIEEEAPTIIEADRGREDETDN